MGVYVYCLVAAKITESQESAELLLKGYQKVQGCDATKAK